MLASSVNGRGLYAKTQHNSTSSSTATFAVLGQDASTSGSFNSGVYGTSVRGTGVTGVSTNGNGVSATSTYSIAVRGTSTNYLGVYGSGPSYGLYGSGTNGYGVLGVTGVNGVAGTYGSGAQYGAYGSSGSGTGVYASSSSGYALEAHTGAKVGAYVTNTNGNGGDVAGSYIGLVARSNTFPLVATDAGGNNLFYVDGSGNVHFHGSLQSFSERAPGVTLYGSQSTAPALEETGTAHLAFGRARVYFSSNFARAIDVRRGYQVFLTPNGDTRGLYVQGKYARGFIVREIGGGRGNLDFDYRIYARTGESAAPGAAAEPNARPVVRAGEPPAPPALRQSRP